jgi:hypothetical protein
VLLLADFSYDGQQFAFREPVSLLVREVDGEFRVDDDDMEINVWAGNFETMLDEIHESICAMWNKVAQQDDSVLSPKAKRLRDYYRRVLS